MDTEKTNEIKVEDYIEVSAILKQVDIENAKQVLKSAGYFIDNLWQTCDVIMNYDCTKEQAQEVLSRALSYESIYELVWDAIKFEAESMKLKNKE